MWSEGFTCKILLVTCEGISYHSSNMATHKNLVNPYPILKQQKQNKTKQNKQTEPPKPKWTKKPLKTRFLKILMLSVGKCIEQL